MTADQYLAAVGRTYVRARALQKHLLTLAAEAEINGCLAQALSLHRMSERPMIVAERYIETLQERF
jgi:hypothetical protein